MAGASNRSDYMSSTVHDLERADCSGELDEQGWDGGGIRCQHVSLLDLQQDQMVGVSCKIFTTLLQNLGRHHARDMSHSISAPSPE